MSDPGDLETVGASQGTVISIDAMSGDLGPEPVVSGMARAAKRNPDLRFIVHGRRDQLEKLIAKKRVLDGLCDIRDAEGVVSMSEKPGQVMRNGKGTSMWSAIESVRDHEAEAVVSCGNTGALMLLSIVRLRKLPGVNRPAIACLWPSKNETGFNVMLDVGADIKADEDDLLKYAKMGASYARNGFHVQTPRVGLLNVGTEEHKGRPELRAAHDLITDAADDSGFEFVGFVEGGDIPSQKVDVVVTDGFTGNVALKTGEGTASLIGELLREAFRYSPLSRLAALLALPSLKRLGKRIDPRRVNGGVFLGLNGTVVKSHGSSDHLGVEAAIRLASTLAQSRFAERLKARVADPTANEQFAATKEITGTNQ